MRQALDTKGRTLCWRRLPRMYSSQFVGCHFPGFSHSDCVMASLVDGGWFKFQHPRGQNQREDNEVTTMSTESP